MTDGTGICHETGMACVYKHLLMYQSWSSIVMSECRIVFNDQTDLYRVERRRWWGWSSVLDSSGEHYASFECCEDAREFVCKHMQRKNSSHRRWKVIGICGAFCPEA